MCEIKTDNHFEVSVFSFIVLIIVFRVIFTMFFVLFLQQECFFFFYVLLFLIQCFFSVVVTFLRYVLRSFLVRAPLPAKVISTLFLIYFRFFLLSVFIVAYERVPHACNSCSWSSPSCLKYKKKLWRTPPEMRWTVAAEDALQKKRARESEREYLTWRGRKGHMCVTSVCV